MICTRQEIHGQVCPEDPNKCPMRAEKKQIDCSLKEKVGKEKE